MEVGMDGNKEKSNDTLWAYRDALDEQEKVIAEYQLEIAQPGEENTKSVDPEGIRRIRATNARVKRALGEWIDALESWLQLHV
jgi:hypothetical protein